MERSSNGQKNDFHIEEYKALREEILQNDQSKNQIELLTFASCGLIYWFNISSRSNLSSLENLVLWFMPTFLIMVGYVWSRSYVERSKQIGKYINAIEHNMAENKLGWENFLQRERDLGGSVVSRPKKVIWLIVFAISLLLGLQFGFQIFPLSKN